MKPLEPRSVVFVLGALLALFMLFLAFNGWRQPEPAATGFGLGLADPRDAGWLAVKAGRDLAVGLLLITMLALRDRRGLLVVVLTALVVPLNDGLQVILHDPSRVGYALAVHGSAAAFGVVLVALLARSRRASA